MRLRRPAGGEVAGSKVGIGYRTLGAGQVEIVYASVAAPLGGASLHQESPTPTPPPEAALDERPSD